MRRTAAILLALSGFTCSGPGESSWCTLDLELGEPGLVRVRAGGVPVALDGLLHRGQGIQAYPEGAHWFMVPGRAALRVPRAPIVIEAFRGLETELSRVEFDLTGKERGQARIELRRFVNAGRTGWRSGNTHLHLQKMTRGEADRYLEEVSTADNLDALFVSYLERADDDREYISNVYTDADYKAFTAKTGVLFGNGEEHRHNFAGYGEGYGHVMFLNLPRLIHPASIGPGIMKTGTDGRPLQKGIDEAKKDGATILWCHNAMGLEDVPNWVTGRPHAQNIFDGGTIGSYEETFYRYLNAGLRVPFSTGTDWFAYDLCRVYVHAPAMKTTRDWLAALEQGKTFITNGPLLVINVEGVSIGETMQRTRPGMVGVVAVAQGRIDFGRLEIVRNGKVVATAKSRKSGAGYVAAFNDGVELHESAWLAARTPPPPPKETPGSHPRSELGGPLFSHTSPVYVEVAGQPIFQEQAARSLIEEVRRAQETVGKTALFADDHERGHVLEVYAAAIAALEKKLR